MRNRVTNSVKRAKQTYNTKAFWRTMKKMIPGNKSSGGSKNINIEGVLCSEASVERKLLMVSRIFLLAVVFLLKKEALIKKLMDPYQILNLNW